MSIIELIKKIESSEKTRTSQQRIALLQKAHILNANGEFNRNFFKSEQSDKVNKPA